MDEAIRAALGAWADGQHTPLARLLGFRTSHSSSNGSRGTVIGRSGSAQARLLPADCTDAAVRMRRIARRDPLRQHLFFAPAAPARLELLVLDPRDRVRRLRIEDVRAPRAWELDALRDLLPRSTESGVGLALHHLRGMDRTRAGTRFFTAFRDMRTRVSVGWRGLPETRRRERDRLALLFLCRLMFLYFLQRTGHLANRTDYFAWLRRRHAREPRRATFYRATLVPLFHGVLNRRPERRSPRAARLGRVPYLNGGLFERDACERGRRLDLPDDVVNAVFDGLLERFRFTARERDAESGSADAIDPEMLGRVFEGLMESDERARSGTFYTPSSLVDEVVVHGLAALACGRAGMSVTDATRAIRKRDESLALLEPQLRGVRALDPACGSGAFLLGTIAQIGRIREACGRAPAVDELVADCVHGVDAQDGAALLCALRLWLMLLGQAGEDVSPLPNLDRRVRQGDALLDPFDLYSARHIDRAPLIGDGAFRERIATLSRAARAYLTAEPETKAAHARQVRAAENALALAWVDAQASRLQMLAMELRALEDVRDLFGERATTADVAKQRLDAVTQQIHELRTLRRRLLRGRSVPFFSFLVHFADAMETGFDLVVSNPPWVRAHRWPKATAALVRERYETCRRPGWHYATSLLGTSAGVAAQVDLAVLFLELSVRVLRPGGVIALLLPAKLLRSLFAAGARRLLLERTELLLVQDRGLERASAFNADAFVATIVARKRSGNCVAQEPVRIVLHDAGGRALEYTARPDELPLVGGDAAAPWLLAPPPVAAILRAMQANGAPIGAQRDVHIHRGVVTGANEVLVFRDVEPKLSGLSMVRAEGTRAQDDEYCAVLESDCIRPLVRGADLRAWQCAPSRHVLWLYDERLQLRSPPLHTARYLERHAHRVGGSGARGALGRVSRTLLEPIVMWRDLAPMLEAIPMTEPRHRPVPLNSVYFVGTRRSEADALLLAAYLNSLPLRVFARTIAERAKNGYFRFFAWTVAVLPLPREWRSRSAALLRSLAQTAAAAGCIDPDGQQQLDHTVGAAFGLSSEQIDELRRFDSWFTGAAT